MESQQSQSVLRVIDAAVDRTLKNAGAADILYNRYVVLSHMVDWWLDDGFIDFPGQIVLTAATNEIKRIRARLPEAMHKVPEL